VVQVLDGSADRSEQTQNRTQNAYPMRFCGCSPDRRAGRGGPAAAGRLRMTVRTAAPDLRPVQRVGNYPAVKEIGMRSQDTVATITEEPVE
jgi:hypothetical protein